MSNPLRYRLALGLLFAAVLLPLGSPSSQELQNLEVIFRKSYTEWEPDTIKVFGSGLCAAGDVNGDGYDDFAAEGWDYRASPGGWRSIVFVFYGGGDLDTIPDVLLEDDYWGGSSGGGIAGGDVNGDGFSDVVVGLPYGPGNVDVYFGGDPMDATVDLILFEEPPELYFGCAVATGDVNGDGYCDIVASDYYKNSGRGAVYVFYGGPLLDNVPDITLRGHGYEGFGTSVGSGGDVNSDGYDDIVIGAWSNDELYGDAGRIYMYYGGNPMDTVYDAAMYGEGPGHQLGWQPVDICRNSYSWGYDFVVAATMFWPDGFPGMCPGKLYILSGGNPMDGIPDLWMHGQTDSSGLGIVSSAGDVDGDGIEDVVGGAIVGVDYMGAVYLWLAGPGMDTLPDAWMNGDSTFLGVGWTVSSAGDVNGDGRDEVAFSNCFYSAVGHMAHTVWVCRYVGTGINENGAQASPREGSCSIRCQPNPFSKSTVVSLVVDGGTPYSRQEGVCVVVHDVAGRVVRRLLLSAPSFRAIWDGRDDRQRPVPSGTYFARAEGVQSAECRLVLVR